VPLPSPVPTRTFPSKLRLTHATQFDAVYAARAKKVRGPLALFALPNSLPHPRLGLSVARAVGNAPRRNRIKRLLREAFRHLQHDLPRRDSGAYDYVVAVRAHPPQALEQYTETFAQLAAALHRDWDRRESP
jgi:ribonuclease P protein component